MEHHAHDSGNNVFKVGINLTIACLLSGILIAATYAITSPIAAKEREHLKERAMKELVTDAQSFNPVKTKEKDGWYEAVKDGKILAYVVPAESKGYGGTIKMVVAVSADGRVKDYKILQHNETPGLGDKAGDPKFKNQFHGKNAELLQVVKTPTEQNIQALTGATITSRAVTKGIREAAEAVVAFTAATTK